MARFGECGWPVGTRVRMKNSMSVKADLRGKEAIISNPLKDYSDLGYTYGYFLHVDGLERLIFAEDWLVEFVSFQIPLQNWVRNRVDLLYNVNPEVAATIATEMKSGDFPYGGGTKNE